jgi:hypothetical protein
MIKLEVEKESARIKLEECKKDAAIELVTKKFVTIKELDKNNAEID